MSSLVDINCKHDTVNNFLGPLLQALSIDSCLSQKMSDCHTFGGNISFAGNSIYGIFLNLAFVIFIEATNHCWGRRRSSSRPGTAGARSSHSRRSERKPL